MKTPKLCIVSSCGGHLTEVRCLLPAYQDFSHFYVLNDKALLPADMQTNTYFISHSERDLLFFVNLWQSFWLLWKERPSLILSTGAGPAVPVALVGRYLFGCTIVFIETITRIDKPSLTGRLMYRLSHHFYYQWRTLAAVFPRGHYGGPLL